MNEVPVITGIGAICSLGKEPSRIVKKIIDNETNFVRVPFDSALLKKPTLQAPFKDEHPHNRPLNH